MLERLSEQGLSGVYLSSSHVFDGDLPNRGVDDITSQKINMDSKNAKLKNFITKNGLPFAILARQGCGVQTTG